MRANKLFKRPKAENGAGRSVKIKHLLLPEEVVDNLRHYRDSYSICLATEKDEAGNPIPIKVTFEQMLRRWMDQVGRFDPDVATRFVQDKQHREEEQERMAAGFGLTPEQLEENIAAFDPTDPANKPWMLKYVFEKNGEEMEAIPGDKAPFYAKIGGRNVGMRDLLFNGWIFMNELGNELDIDQAWQINRLIKEHPEK